MPAGNIAADLLVHVGANVQEALSGLDSVDQKANKTSENMGKAGLAMGGASLAIIGGLGGAINKAADFEQVLSNIGAVGGPEAQAAMSQISDLALKIGQDTSFSAAQGAQAIDELVKAGVPLKDVLDGAAMSAADLAEAGQISIPDAATAMSNAMNMFGIAGDQASTVADSFAAAANASSSSVADLTMALSQGGATASSWGLSLNQTNTAFAIFSNLGLKGADAGTSFKQMLTSLNPVSDDAAAALNSMGISAEDFSSSADPMLYLTQKLTEGTKGMSIAQRNAALTTIFGTDASRAAIDLIEAGPDAYAKMTDAVNKQGVAQDIAKQNMDNLNGAIESLMGSIETAMILVGQTFTPILQSLAKEITKGVNMFLKLPKPIQHLTGIVIAAVAGFLALVSGIAIVLSYGAPVIAMVTAMAAPLIIIIAILAALYLAWSTNFLGIQNVTSSSLGQIVPLFTNLAKYLGYVANGGDMTTASMAAIPAPLRNITKVLGVAVDAFHSLYENLAAGRGVNAALDAFGKIISGPKMTGALGKVGDQLLNAFKNIDWTGIGKVLLDGMGKAALALADVGVWLISKLGDLTGAIGGWLLDKASAVDWAGILSQAASLAGDITGAIVSKLGNLTSAVGGWIADQVSKVDWVGDFTTAAAFVGDITGPIVGKLGDLTSAIGGWLSAGAIAVPWNGILSGAVTGITSLAASMIPHLGNLATELKTWYDSELSSIDWNNLGVIVGQKVHDMAAVLIPAMTSMITGATTYLAQHWQDIGKAVLGLIVAAPVVIGYVGATLLPKVAEFLGGFLTGLGVNWTSIGNWLKGMPGRLLAGVPGLAGVLLDAGSQLISGLLQGAQDYWPTVAGWLKSMPGLILKFYVAYLTLLYTAGTWLITGLYNGAIAFWPTLKSWIVALPGAISTAISSAGSLLLTLKDAGVQLIAGLLAWVSGTFETTMVPWLTSLPGLIQTNIGNLSFVLYNTGVQLIQGMISGLDAMKGYVTNKVQEFVNIFKNLLPDWMGLGSPSKMTMYYGEMLGQGLAIGMDNTRKAVMDSAQNLVNLSDPGNIGRTNTALSQANTHYVTQNFQIDVHADDLEDIVEAGRFIQTLPTSRAAYMRGVN
jgi:TP901 family phage tail tape measure protein